MSDQEWLHYWEWSCLRVTTNVFLWFVIFPAKSFGLLGQKAPEGVHLTRMSFWNHLMFGAGIALWTAILKPS